MDSDLIAAAIAADDAWQEELERLYGADAGDVRYTKAGEGAPGTTLRGRYEAFRAAADKAWPLD